MRLLVATTNPGKLQEISRLVAELPVTLLSLRDVEEGPPPEENGSSFEENARLKAETWMGRTGLPCLADDSGLSVDHLGGSPGIHSARYAGPDASPADNNAKLLAALRGAPQEERHARFTCVATLAQPDQPTRSFRGVVEGLILERARGSDGCGFGYDPLFLYPPLNRTFAELSAEEKDAVSHRGQALRQLVLALRQQLSGAAAGVRK